MPKKNKMVVGAATWTPKCSPPLENDCLIFNMFDEASKKLLFFFVKLELTDFVCLQHFSGFLKSQSTVNYLPRTKYTRLLSSVMFAGRAKRGWQITRVIETVARVSFLIHEVLPPTSAWKGDFPRPKPEFMFDIFKLGIAVTPGRYEVSETV